MAKRSIVLAGGLALVSVIGASGPVACGGGDDVPAPSGTSMDARPRAQRVRGAGAPPEIASVRFEPESPVSGEPVRAIVEARDPDGDAVRLGFAWKVGGRSVAGSDDRIDLAGARKGDAIEVVVTASDGAAQSEGFEARTRVGNAAPKLDQVLFEPAGEVPVGVPIGARPVARDADGDTLEYRFVWRVNGEEVPETSATLRTDTLKRGDAIEVDVVASDGDDDSDRVHAAGLRIVNDVPRIVSAPPGDLPDGVYRYRVEAKDADGDRTLRFRLAQGPSGMQIDALTGELTWTPSVGQTGRHPVEIAVDDGQGGRTTQRFELSVDDVPGQASAPAAAPPAAPSQDGEASGDGDEAAAVPAPAPPSGRRGRAMPAPAAPTTIGEEETE